jgi:peptidyl-prolyl cis-trans isomerase SurA
MKLSFFRSIAVFALLLMLQNTAFAQPKAAEKAAGLPDNGTMDRIVTIVGDKATLLSDIEDEFYRLQAERQTKLPEDARCMLLDQVVMQDVMMAQAKLDSIIIPDEEIDQELNERIERILSYMGGDEKQFEAYYGTSVVEVKDKFRDDLIGRKLAQRMQAKIMEGVTVTPSEVRAFFDKIPLDSLPYFNSEVELAQIVLAPKVSEEERKRCITQLAEIRKQIADGTADFGALAKQYSDDPGSGKQGGNLGFQKRGTFVPEFEAAAFSLKRNEISPIVRSQFGYHIIQLLERRGNNINTRHVLIKPKVGAMDIAEVKVKMDSIRAAIAADSLVFSTAVQRFTEDENTKSNAGIISNPQSGSPYFEVGDIEPEVYFAIENLKPGEMTQVLDYPQPDGSTSYRIIQLKSRSEPHQASIETDYNKIKVAALEQKKSKAMNDWMVAHVGKIYIKVNEPYTACPNLAKWTVKP